MPNNTFTYKLKLINELEKLVKFEAKRIGAPHPFPIKIPKNCGSIEVEIKNAPPSIELKVKHQGGYGPDRKILFCDQDNCTPDYEERGEGTGKHWWVEIKHGKCKQKQNNSTPAQTTVTATEKQNCT